MTDATASNATASMIPGTGPDAKPGDPNVVTVRYLSTDIDRSIDFYTNVLDFHLARRISPVIATLTRGPLALLLSGPGSSGARPMPDGREQHPGGSNRILIYVPDLNLHIQKLVAAGAHFMNNVETGPGGKQIQIEDPDGNPIELHEAPKPDQ